VRDLKVERLRKYRIGRTLA